jgi:hypothetical protein
VTSPVFHGLPSAAGGAGGVSSYASPIGLDRLVRKEVGLGAIRERTWPMDHIGLAQIAPFMPVDTDDVIFDYIKGGLQDGLSPAAPRTPRQSWRRRTTCCTGRAARPLSTGR